MKKKFVACSLVVAILLSFFFVAQASDTKSAEEVVAMAIENRIPYSFIFFEGEEASQGLSFFDYDKSKVKTNIDEDLGLFVSVYLELSNYKYSGLTDSMMGSLRVIHEIYLSIINDIEEVVYEASGMRTKNTYLSVYFTIREKTVFSFDGFIAMDKVSLDVQFVESD